MSNGNPRFPNLQLFDHPLIQHKLTWMRDRTTSYRAFRALLAQIAGLMVYEVTRSFATVPVPVDTPMTRAFGQRLASTITVVPILRAGLGMADGVLEVMPEARVGHLGMARDEATLKPKAYLNKLPRDLDAGPVVLVDPMLATGGSACAAISLLRSAGAHDLRMICLVAAPEGVRRLMEADPNVRIYAAALDERLDEHGFIVPGLGDAGDRLYGTV
ncbi:MAG: uracil phosphoribosyltransferase [Phycisphaerales bacterium]|nr:uracil phosphoribosyltransferase [Phycisphaerales bacterium]